MQTSATRYLVTRLSFAYPSRKSLGPPPPPEAASTPILLPATSTRTLSRGSRRLSTDLVPKVALRDDGCNIRHPLANVSYPTFHLTTKSPSFCVFVDEKENDGDRFGRRERGVTTRVAQSGGCRAAYCQNICRFHGEPRRVGVPRFCAPHGHA